MSLNWYVCGIALFAAVGAVVTGFSTGALNGVQEHKGFQEQFGRFFVTESNSTNGSKCGDSDVNTLLGLSVSITFQGSAIGCFIAGGIADYFGRKIGLMSGASLYAIGSTIITACPANYEWLFIIGRAINGFGSGIVYTLIPVYISEMSPKNVRGRLASFFGPSYAIAVLVSFAVAFGSETVYPNGWRITASLTALAGLIYFIGFYFMPHTPRWLVMKHRMQEARITLSKINAKKGPSLDTVMQLQDIVDEVGEKSTEAKLVILKKKIKEIIEWRVAKRILIAGMLFAFESFCGGFIVYYSLTIFRTFTGDELSYSVNIIFGVILIISSLVALFSLDKIGRRSLLLIGSLISALALVTSGVLVQIYDLESEDESDDDSSKVRYIALVFILIFFSCYSCTWLIVPWVYNSEVHPLSVRGTAAAISSTIFWQCDFFSNLVVKTMLSCLRLHGTLYLVGGTNMLAFVLVLFLVPETKGVSLEHMDEIFSGSVIKSWMCHRKRHSGVKTQAYDIDYEWGIHDSDCKPKLECKDE